MNIQKTLLALVLLLTMATASMAAQAVLVVNKANPETAISGQDARNIFLGKKTTWSDGQKIAIVTQNTQGVHASFTRNIVHKTPQQFATYWKKALFTGVGTPPPELGGDEAVKKFVAQNPNALGYISAGALDGSVKRLRVR